MNNFEGLATKAVILARVSSREQEEGYSIDAQVHRLKEYCNYKKLEVIKVYEIVESSSRGDRKNFKEMIKFARSHRETIAIVADKVDRTQRRISEIPMLEEPIKAGKIELHFRTEGYILHKDSHSQAKLTWGMNVLMAQSYIDNLSDNVKRSFEQKLRQGEWIGPAPLGYLNAKDQKGSSIVVLDPVRGPLVKRMFEEYASGIYTISSTVKKVKEWGLRSKGGMQLSKSVIHRLMQNAFYYGEMMVKGEMHTHVYPPLITREIFMECKKVREGWNKNPFKHGQKEFIFRGFFKCAVTGKVVTADTKKKKLASGEIKEFTYLVTWDPNNPQKRFYVREDEILAQIRNILGNIGIKDPEVLKNTLEHLKSTKNLKQSDYTGATTALKKEHTEIGTKLDKLTTLRMDNELTKEEFILAKQKLKDRQYEISNQLLNYDKADDKFIETTEMLINIASAALETFDSSSVDKKQQMLKFIFSNCELKGANLQYALRFPFDIFEKTTTCSGWRE